MGSSSDLDLDPLFLGLTRPALIGGVTFVYFAFNFFLCTILFVLTSDFKSFIFGVFLHFIGMYICKKEPLAIDILLAKFKKCPNTLNKNFHGGLNSYNMF
jgi:type IV secretion system protein VirB3